MTKLRTFITTHASPVEGTKAWSIAALAGWPPAGCHAIEPASAGVSVKPASVRNAVTSRSGFTPASSSR